MSSRSESNNVSLKTRFQLAARSIITGIAFRSDGTVNRRLLDLADLKSPPSTTPINGVKSFDHTIDPSRDLWFRTFIPINVADSPLPIIVYFHGGGFVSFSPSTRPFDTLCRRIAAATPAVVVSVNYRLAPEHKFPTQYDDALDTLKYLDQNRDKIVSFPGNADLGRCFIAGDSAGGNVAHHVAVWAAETEFSRVKVVGVVAIQPFFGGEERTGSELRFGSGSGLSVKRTDFYWKAFLPGGSTRDHPAANVFGVDARDLAGVELPGVLVVIGGKDLLQDWQRRYCEGLRRCGKEVEVEEYPDVGHGFYASQELHEYGKLVARIGEFVQKRLQLLN